MLIAFKLKLAMVCAAGLAGPLAVTPLLTDTGSPDKSLRDRPAMVALHPGTVSYRMAGDFTRAGRQTEAPLRSVRFAKPLSIMKHQVSAADYQQCVDEASCRALERGVAVAADRPAVQVSRRLCGLALAQDRRALPAADRRGVGLRGGKQVQR